MHGRIGVAKFRRYAGEVMNISVCSAVKFELIILGAATFIALRVKEDNRTAAIRRSQQKNGRGVSDGWRRSSGQVIGANEGAIRPCADG
ncbi:hypothetical protein MHYP_G00303930 [Metynnis hypsauchen]